MNVRILTITALFLLLFAFPVFAAKPADNNMTTAKLDLNVAGNYPILTDMIIIAQAFDVDSNECADEEISIFIIENDGNRAIFSTNLRKECRDFELSNDDFPTDCYIVTNNDGKATIAVPLNLGQFKVDRTYTLFVQADSIESTADFTVDNFESNDFPVFVGIWFKDNALMIVLAIFLIVIIIILFAFARWLSNLSGT